MGVKILLARFGGTIRLHRSASIQRCFKIGLCSILTLLAAAKLPPLGIARGIRSHPQRNSITRSRVFHFLSKAAIVLRTGGSKDLNSSDSMSNHDLLSSLAGKPAAEMLLNHYGGLVNLAKASFSELTQVKGIGESKAKAIKSAFLLAQRLAQESLPEAPLLDTPDRVAEVLREEHRLYTVEHLHVALLNTRRRLIRLIEISTGSLDTILVHPREVFKPAIVFNASALVLAHNHPSGDPSPSEADIRMTRDLIRAGQLLKIEVLDHLILGQRTAERPRDYVSLKELGFFCI